VPDVKEQLKKGMKVGNKTFKVHLDDYNITDALAGKAPSPRHEFFYFNDDGSLVGLRYDQWKIVGIASVIDNGTVLGIACESGVAHACANNPRPAQINRRTSGDEILVYSAVRGMEPQP
jgi:hypothetical protein